METGMAKQAKDDTSKKIMITFQEGGENGGPFISHQRIMNSSLKEKYLFIPLRIKKPKEQLKMKNFLSLVRYIKTEKPDIIHFTGLQLVGFVSLLAARIAGCKNTVCAVRGTSMDALSFHGWKRFLMLLLENWTLKHSRLCYGVSEYVANWGRVKKYGHCYGSIYNFPDSEEQKKKTDNHIREELSIPQDHIVVISTGRITEDKGFDVLLDVICTGDWGKKIDFIIVGDGEYLNTMREKITTNAFEKQVHFVGYKRNIVDYLDASDVFIICTKHETLCNSVVEASNHGLPVIASNTGGIPEIVNDGISGYLVDVCDVPGFINKLHVLIDSPSTRLLFGKKGSEIIRSKFSEETISEKLDLLYTRVIKQKDI